ncbi:MAG: histidine phosphatase family protein [Planctomycetota bacterium]|nr:histidine phosphatase family protein [Planctomycetota bacterium]
MPRLLYLARHGTTGPAYAGRYVGSTDAPLSPEGREEAAALGRRFRGLGIEKCFSSPLRRARETAEIAAGPLGVPLAVDPDLREVDFGDWEGKTFAEILAGDPAGVEKWAAFAGDFRFPGGEALRDFEARVEAAAGRLAADCCGRIAAVAHGGVVKGIVCRLLGLPLRCHVLFSIKPASITTIEFRDGKPVLAGLNDVCHLDGRTPRTSAASSAGIVPG